MNLRDFFGVGIEWEKNIFKNNNEIMGFVNGMDKNMAKYWYPNEKMVVVPICLNGSCCHSGYMGNILRILTGKKHSKIKLQRL